MNDVLTDRNEIVLNNLGLVHSCANKFRNRGVEYDDLFQAGCIGLLKAADKFDAERGFSFSTYAVPVILGEIKKIFRDGGSIKIGRALKEKSRMVLKKKDEIALELGREPSLVELANILKIEKTDVAMLLNASMPTVSLTCADDEEKQADIPTDSPEENVSNHLALHQVIETLDERDRKIIELRYFDGLTQSKTAEKLGMSQVQVSRREKSILQIIRKKLCA